jgi:hypothetical protein
MFYRFDIDNLSRRSVLPSDQPEFSTRERHEDGEQSDVDPESTDFRKEGCTAHGEIQMAEGG